MSYYSSIQFKVQKIAEALRTAEHDSRMQSLPANLLKRLVLLFSLVLLASPASVVYGQQTVSWRTEAANGNWENGDCSSIGTANSQWWYAGFTPNNARNRPDCNDGSTTRHNVEIANNHQTTMSLNTAFWGLRSLMLTNAATSNRTFNGSPDNATRGISLTNGLYNNSNSGVTHNFNVCIGIDATSVTLRTLTSGATTNFAREIFGNANTVVFDGSGATNVTSLISGVGATVSKQGTGTLTLSGANTYTGNTSVVAGILRLGAANVISNSSNMVLAGGTFSTGAAAGFAQTVGTLTVSANSTLAFGTGGHIINFANSNANTWGGFLFVTGWTGSFNGTVGTAGRFFAGNSTTGLTAEQLQRVLFLNGSNYHTATILASGEVVPSASVAMFWNGGGVASWTAANAWSQNPAGPYNQTWTSGRTAYFNLANNTITGATTNAAGIVALGNVTLSNSGTLGFGASGGGIAPIYVAAGIAFTSTQDFSTAAGTGLIKNGPGVFSSSNSNATGLPAGITLNGGALVWAGVSGFGSGTLTINGGVLSNNNATAKSPNIASIVANADFAFGSTTLVPAGTGNLTFAATLNLGASATRTVTLAQLATYAINGIISGSGSNLVLNASAAGTLSLGGANTYGGNTTINGGTLLLSTGNNRLPVTTNLTLANTAGATFNLGNQAQTIASLSGGGASGGNIVTGGSSGDLTVNQTTSTTYAGVMSGTGDLIKTGNGVLTFSGANTYSGVTTLSAGTLLVNGSTASTSAVTVAAGATLGGSGTTAGTVALNGTVAPGSAAATVGVLNAGPFTFNNSSSYKFDISNVSGTAGVNWDLLTSSGQITVNSSSGSLAVISLTGNPAGFNSCTPYTWRIAQGSSISSFDATKFTINTASFIPAFVGTFSIQQSGNALNLVYSGASLTLTSAAGTNAQLRCINTAITNITYATTGTTGATVSGLPAGVTSNWASNVLTISGTPTAYGLYTYTVTLTGTCSSVSITGTINVNGVDWSNLQFPASTIICQGSNTTVYGRVFELGITEAAGSNAVIEAQIGYNNSNTNPSGWAAGNWANATFNVQAGNNDEYQATFGSTLTAGTYYYTFRFRINGCAWQYGGYNSGGGGFWDGTTNISGVLTVNPPTPAQPAAITGTAVKCPGLTGQVYSISAVTNATSYNWTVPTGWTITANTGVSITVTTGTTGQNGNISVTAQNSCGTSTARTLAVTVSPATPAVPTAASGTNAACTTISANWAASTNATAYFLDVSTVITFSSFVGAYNNLNVGNVNTLSVTGLTAGVTYFYRVRANNSCGTSASSATITYSTTPATPAQPGTITGTTAQCAARTGQVYSISAVANATTYNWTVPTGWTIAAGAGTTSITVTTGAGGQNGNIGVRAQNSCGTSSERTLGVTVTPNPTVNVGAGLAAICAGGNSAALGGSVTSPATGGTWSTPAGGTFNPSATTLNATWTAPAAFSGTATLTLTSSGGACGTASGSKSITVNPLPANAGAITGTATVCEGQSGVSFAVPAISNAPGYSWSYSGTGFTASGNTASIFGSFSASATSGNLTVRGVNSCGNGVASATYAITVGAVPAAAGTITGSPTVCQGQNNVAFSVPAIAGATSYQWSYTGTGFTASGNTPSITANFSVSATSGILTVRGVNSCGNGVASANYTIAIAQLPGTPGTILGPSTVCKGQVGFSFIIPAITNATSYNWQYTGTGVTFSGNTNLVTITVSNTATAGDIRVRGVSGCLNGPFSANFPITIIEPPTVSITSNYCGNPGFVILTASTGFTNYLWNTGANTSFINADIAGQYSVTVANSFGCLATASVGVATELVTNGSFSAGNTGFTTNYTYVADGAGQTEMYPEGTYAIVPNANSVHNMFWGTGHTPGGGPQMVVNGSPALGQNIWSQNNIAVQPNTTYYFSAWGLSVVNGNNAVLRFSINGNQVGTTAFLPNGYTSAAGPFNWVRFFGSWNSGFATTANLSIVNLNTIAGGNDFSLDDISFGTLSPIPLAVSPSTLLGTTVCQGNELVLNANAVGGASPFTYQWSGPNGFTSTMMNPVVTASVSAANAGTYTLIVTDGFGCTAASTVIVTISALPLNRTPVTSVPSICVDGSSSITIASSQTGISYQLRNDADDSPVGDPIAGTGGTISFPVENLSATSTFNVLATGALTQCSVEMPTTVTVTVATTPVLAITNQAICSGTVDLTAAAVTAGSTGSGTLSYWTDAAGTVALGSPSSVATSGIYYIQSTAGSCSDIEPVSVSISSTPNTSFSYPTTPYCSTESHPSATLGSGAVAGVFSATTAGLVFSNTSTGTIELSASTPGTYTVRNTVSPAGGCPSVNSTSTLVITQAPLTDFTYNAGTDFCQIYNAQNPIPVFGPGAAAGTFASTFGLNFISAATGVVNLQTSTPGNYAIWNTRGAVGGCAAESDTMFIDINPFVFAGTVSTSVSDDIICLGETVDLFSQTSAYSSVLLRERFNGSVNNWVRANSSVGGTVANATWTLRPNNYVYNTNTYRSNDNTQFYMTNSEAQAGTTTLTTLRSPVMSTVGYTNLSLDFFHYFNGGSIDTARVEVSLNNSTWTTVATYTTSQGNRTGFTNPVINLNAYIGQPIFYVRFRYNATNDNYWAIDNVSLTGNCTKYNYNWVSAPAGLSSTSANPVNVTPPQNSFYVVNATNTFGCSNPSSPIPVTVNALPVLTSNLTPPAVCGNELFTYVPTATPAIATIDWTRPATAGISNAAITTPQISNPSEILDNTTGTDKNVIYNIRLNNNGCEQIVPLTIAVKPVPIINIGSNQSVCNGSAAQLNTTISNGLNVGSYLWSPSAGLSNTTISDPTAIVPTASQNYTVTVQSTNGCTSTSAAVSVTNVGFGGTPGLWLGTQNNNWDDCRNWADGKVPDATTNVTIDGSSVGDILITGAQECNNLFFLSTAAGSRTITINPTSSLAATANVAISKTIVGGLIKIQIRNNASMVCANLSLAGSSAGAADALVQKDELSSNITINGNCNLDPGSSFDMNDNNNGTSEGVVIIKGNFVNNANASDFNVGNVSIIFNGSTLQTITCPGNQDFKSVTLDNSSAAGVRLANDITISQQMSFVNGVLDLNSKILTLGSATANATISGSGNNSYILSWDGADNGSVVHRVNSTGTPYLFPIGDLNDYTPFTVNLTSAGLSSATLTAKLIGSVHPNLTTGTIYLGRYWSIEPTGITNPLYNVSYSYAAGDIFGDDALLFPAKYNNGGWQSCLESMSNAMIGNGSVNANDNTISWTGITTFSEFTGVGNGNALPIELLNFTAEPVNNEVQLKWITASEINNNYFTIERSTDGIHFENVVEQAGAGNSNTVRSYDAIDKDPYMGVSYYRLKQTDFNGDFTYSEMVVVNFTDAAAMSIESISSESESETITIRCKNPANQKLNVQIFDSNGKIIHSSNPDCNTSNWVGSIQLGSISRGTYVIRIDMSGNMLYGKFVK